MRRALSGMENALFPRAALCLLCGDPRRAGGQDCLCPACREGLNRLRLRDQVCLRCMTPLDEHGRCAFCAAGGVEGRQVGFAHRRDGPCLRAGTVAGRRAKVRHSYGHGGRSGGRQAWN